MISAFSSYIKTIATFLVFSCFIQLIMPNSDFKKYIDIVLGLIMIIILIKPLNNFLLKSEISVSDLVIENQNNLNKELLNNEIGYYEAAQREIVLNNYKAELIYQISKLIEQRFNVNTQVVVVDVVEDTDSKDFGAINSISLSFQEGVEDIDEINTIKKVIADFYNMSGDNIYIE